MRDASPVRKAAPGRTHGRNARCRRGGIRPGADTGGKARSVGAGPHVRSGDGPPLRTGPGTLRRGPPQAHHRMRIGRGRCLVGDGGGVEMQGPLSGHRRDMGRSESARLHGDEAARHAFRAHRDTGFPDPFGGGVHLVGGPLAVACRVKRFRTASARPACPGRSALAGGTVSRPRRQAGPVGSGL